MCYCAIIMQILFIRSRFLFRHAAGKRTEFMLSQFASIIYSAIIWGGKNIFAVWVLCSSQETKELLKTAPR